MILVVPLDTMKMIFIHHNIIFLIALCTLTCLEATNFPDDGRLVVGKCLDKSFLRINNPLRGVEDYLFGLCRKTQDDYNHIVEKFNEIGEDPNVAFDQLKSCLKEHTKVHPTEDADKLIERYKGFALEAITSQEKFQRLTELVQVVIGLCAEKEWVTFEELEPKYKLEAYSCLESCGARLFRGFQLITQTMQNEYDNYLEQTKLKNNDSENKVTEIDEKNDTQMKDQQGFNRSPAQVEPPVLSDIKGPRGEKEPSGSTLASSSGPSEKPEDYEREDETVDKGEPGSKEGKKSWLKKVRKLFHDITASDKEKYGYKKGIENYEQACKNSEEKNIRVLTKIGKVWAEPYLEDMEAFYDKFHYSPIKFDLGYAFDSYLHCCRWECAMGHREDIPFIDWVIETKTDISATTKILFV